MRTRVAFFVAFFFVCALLVVAVAGPTFVATNDGPNHVFGAWARAHIDDPTLGYAAFLQPNVPVTANGFAEIFALLEPLLGWQRAHQWTLGLIVLVWAAGALAFTVACEPQRRWWALVGATLGAGWPLYLGFFSFVLGGGLVLLVGAAALALPATTRSRVLIASLILVVAAVHFLTAALAGLLVFVVRVAVVHEASGTRTAVREAALVTLMGLPALLLVLRATGASENLGDGTLVVPWTFRLEALGACTLGGPPWRQALVVVPVLGSVVALFAVSGRRLVDRALGVTATLLCTTPLWLPWDMFGWQHAAVRPLPVAACVLFALIPVERASLRIQRATAVVCVVLATSATTWSAWVGFRVASETDDVLRATATKAEPGYRWAFFTSSLPIEREAGLLRWDPQRGLGSLFGVTEGGFVAYAHAVSPQAHTVLLKPDVAASLPAPPLRSREVTPLRFIDDDAARAPLVEVLASKAVQVDGVILAERPADHALWKARGYVPEVESGRVLLAHFVGCDARIVTDEARQITSTPGPSLAGVLSRTDDVPAGGGLLEHLSCGIIDLDGCGATRRAMLTPVAPAEIVCR